MTAIILASLLTAAGLSSGTPREYADTVALDEVTVSATKANGPLFNEPVACTFVSRKEVENLNIVTIRGISDLVPNFFMPDYGSRITSSVYVRGIGARMDQPAVGLNVDNVPVMNKNAYDIDMPDISGVEMLRGPQSMLYGRNTMAGVINVTTLSPLKYQGVRFQAGYSSGNTWKLSAGYYHRINSRMGISATAGYMTTDGFFRNFHNGEKLDHEKQITGRLKYEFHIRPDLTLQNVAYLTRHRQGGYPYEEFSAGKIAYNDPCNYRRFTFNDGLTLRKIHEKFTLTSISSVQYMDDRMTLDQDFTARDYFTLTQSIREWGLTQEFVARGNNTGWHTWLSGVFGYYKNGSLQAPVTFKEAGISNLIVHYRNLANPEFPIAWNSDSFVLNSDFTNPTWGLAAYHQSTFSLGPVTVEAGLRLDYEKAALRYHSYTSTGYEISQLHPDGSLSHFGNVDIDIDDAGRLTENFVTLLPKLTVKYDFGESRNPANVYLNVSKGYKAGGYNTQMFSDVLQQRLMEKMGIGNQYNVADIVSYKPEKSWNYEVGAHISAIDGRLMTQVALFYIDIRDQQLTKFPEGNTTGRIMTNAGKTRSFGAEVSVNVDPVDNFRFIASYGYTNARFREYNNGVTNLKGKRIPYAPENTLFLQATYTYPLKWKFLNRLEIGANMKGTGKIWWNDENTRSQNLYFQAGGYIRFDAPHWSLEFFGDNLTDTRFDTFYFVSMGNEFKQRGKPRQIGVTFRLDI